MPATTLAFPRLSAAVRTLRGAVDTVREMWRGPLGLPEDARKPSRLPTIVQLPTFTRPEWTPAGVRAAIIAADMGDLGPAGDLCEAMFTDPVFSGVLASRTFGLLGREMQFSTGGHVYSPLPPARAETLRRRAATSGDFEKWTALHDRRLLWRTDGVEVWSAPAAQYAGLVPPDSVAMLRDDWRTLYPEAELAKLVAWGLVLGVGWAERVPMVNRRLGERDVPTLRVWHSRHFRQDVTTGEWFVMTATGEEPVCAGDGRWIAYMPYGEHRPWAQGKWRENALPYVLKLNAIYDRARHSEVCGSPARVGTAPQGADETDRRKMLRDIANMGRDNAIVYPEGYSLKLLEAVGETWGIYDATIAWADKSYRVSLTSNETTTSESKGFSDGSTQASTKLDLDRFTNESLATTLQHQGTCHYSMANEGTMDACRGEWEIDPAVDRKAEADILTSLGQGITALDAAIKSSGKACDTTVILARFDIPTRELPVVTALPVASVGPDPGAEPLTDEQATKLAATMTALQADRCWHNTVNSCRFCRVEQRREPVAGPDGKVTWAIAWHPIARPVMT